jgi:glycosyltransferase involved in cell wall biosynthesis
MNRGGVETWLMHLLRHIDRSAFEMDFVVHAAEPGIYDDEIRSLGSRVVHCPHPSHPLRYGKNLYRILRRYGPYDVVHSHVHHYSGYTLRLAALAGIPIRIAHSHNDTVEQEAKAGAGRRLYLTVMERWIRRYATVRLACSARAGRALVSRDAAGQAPWETLYYGIDMAPFEPTAGGRDVRAELKIDPQAFVVGHVGRFDPQKNHNFLIDIAAELSRHDPKMCLLLIGDGPLRAAVQRRVKDAGLADHVVFAGVRTDVPRLMKDAMDAFLFPSLYEGLGLVLVEAQAAGLPCVCSDVVPEEADVVPALITRLPLSEPALVWADTLLAARAAPHCMSRALAYEQTMRSPFNIRSAVKRMESVYWTSASSA